MRKEVSQGLGLLAVAAVFALLAVATRDSEGIGPVIRLGAFLFAIGGLVMLAVGLLRRA